MNLPPYILFPELRTGGLLLREVKPDDIPHLLEILTYDGKSVETLDQGVEIIRKIDQNYREGESVNWIIEELETNQLIGFVGYYRGFENGFGEIGFVLKEAFRGKGFMSQSLQLAVDFGINRMWLRQVRAFTKPDNEKAIAVLERNGFVSDYKPEGKYLEFVYFG